MWEFSGSKERQIVRTGAGMLKLEWFAAHLGIPKMGPEGAGTFSGSQGGYSCRNHEMSRLSTPSWTVSEATSLPCPWG